MKAVQTVLVTSTVLKIVGAMIVVRLTDATLHRVKAVLIAMTNLVIAIVKKEAHDRAAHVRAVLIATINLVLIATIGRIRPHVKAVLTGTAMINPVMPDHAIMTGEMEHHGKIASVINLLLIVGMPHHGMPHHAKVVSNGKSGSLPHATNSQVIQMPSLATMNLISVSLTTSGKIAGGVR